MDITNLKKQHYSVANKLKILKLFSKRYSVGLICYDYKIHKTTFYKWKKRYEGNNNLGLERKPKATFSHPQKTKSNIAQQVIEFSIKHPNFGCCRVATELGKVGLRISSPTVQKILIGEKLGKIEDRVFALEKKHVQEKWNISPSDIKLITHINPCFKNINQIGMYPGQILVQDTFPVFKLFPNTYISVVIDTYSYLTFAYPVNEKSSEIAIDVLSSKALRYFRQKNLEVKKVITGRGREFTHFRNEYTTYLSERNIAHEIYAGKERNWHGYIEKYKRDFFKRFNVVKNDKYDFVTLRELDKKTFDDRLSSQKRARGFPTFGASPSSMVRVFQSKV